MSSIEIPFIIAVLTRIYGEAIRQVPDSMKDQDPMFSVLANIAVRTATIAHDIALLRSLCLDSALHPTLPDTLYELSRAGYLRQRSDAVFISNTGEALVEKALPARVRLFNQIPLPSSWGTPGGADPPSLTSPHDIVSLLHRFNVTRYYTSRDQSFVGVAAALLSQNPYLPPGDTIHVVMSTPSDSSGEDSVVRVGSEQLLFSRALRFTVIFRNGVLHQGASLLLKACKMYESLGMCERGVNCFFVHCRYRHGDSAAHLNALAVEQEAQHSAAGAAAAAAAAVAASVGMSMAPTHVDVILLRILQYTMHGGASVDGWIPNGFISADYDQIRRAGLAGAWDGKLRTVTPILVERQLIETKHVADTLYLRITRTGEAYVHRLFHGHPMLQRQPAFPETKVFLQQCYFSQPPPSFLAGAAASSSVQRGHPPGYLSPPAFAPASSSALPANSARIVPATASPPQQRHEPPSRATPAAASFAFLQHQPAGAPPPAAASAVAVAAAVSPGGSSAPASPPAVSAAASSAASRPSVPAAATATSHPAVPDQDVVDAVLLCILTRNATTPKAWVMMQDPAAVFASVASEMRAQGRTVPRWAVVAEAARRNGLVEVMKRVKDDGGGAAAEAPPGSEGNNEQQQQQQVTESLSIRLTVAGATRVKEIFSQVMQQPMLPRSVQCLVAVAVAHLHSAITQFKARQTAFAAGVAAASEVLAANQDAAILSAEQKQVFADGVLLRLLQYRQHGKCDSEGWVTNAEFVENYRKMKKKTLGSIVFSWDEMSPFLVQQLAIETRVLDRVGALRLTGVGEARVRRVFHGQEILEQRSEMPPVTEICAALRLLVSSVSPASDPTAPSLALSAPEAPQQRKHQMLHDIVMLRILQYKMCDAENGDGWISPNPVVLTDLQVIGCRVEMRSAAWKVFASLLVDVQWLESKGAGTLQFVRLTPSGEQHVRRVFAGHEMLKEQSVVPPLEEFLQHLPALQWMSISEATSDDTAAAPAASLSAAIAPVASAPDPATAALSSCAAAPAAASEAVPLPPAANGSLLSDDDSVAAAYASMAEELRLQLRQEREEHDKQQAIDSHEKQKMSLTILKLRAQVEDMAEAETQTAQQHRLFLEKMAKEHARRVAVLENHNADLQKKLDSVRALVTQLTRAAQ